MVIAGKYDQYLVRVHGTGRLTVRNRRFLRKYTLRSPTVENVNELPRISSKDLAAPKSVTETTHHNVKEPRKVVAQHDEPVSRDLPSIADEQEQSLPLGDRSDTASSPVAIEERPKSPTYRKIPNVSPGLIEVFKHFLGGLYSGGLTFGGAYIRRAFCVSVRVSRP